MSSTTPGPPSSPPPSGPPPRAWWGDRTVKTKILAAIGVAAFVAVLVGVLGISFCAIGILTGMSSAFQTGLFSGGPLGLFWGWNVSAASPSHLLCVHAGCALTERRYAASSCF